MSGQTIHKTQKPESQSSILSDYQEARSAFSWDDARSAIQWPKTGSSLNIAASCLDRHIANGRGGNIALKWIDKQGNPVAATYSDLSNKAAKFANVLTDLGVNKGDRVFCLLGRTPDLYETALGTWKMGAVFLPSILSIRTGADFRAHECR